MKTHKSVKEREAGRTPRDTKSEPNLSHKQTQAHKVSEKKGGHISFSPANVIDVGVCVSGCVMPDNRFSLMLTTFWNSWEVSHLVQYHIRSSWGAASTSVNRTVSQTQRLHIGVEHRDRYWSTVYKGNSTCTGHVCIRIPLFCATWSSTFTQSVLLTLSALLLQSSDRDGRLSSKSNRQQQREMDNSPGKTIFDMEKSFTASQNLFFYHFDATNKWNITI